VSYLGLAILTFKWLQYAYLTCSRSAHSFLGVFFRLTVRVVSRIRIDENDPQAILDIQTCKLFCLWTDILRLSFRLSTRYEALKH
jgi:hypothetical protein